MQAFLQPPSAGEERDYFRRMRFGDQMARELLIMRNMRLVAYIAKKYNDSDSDAEDLISIGTIGLIKAVDSFDAEKGVRLAGYASKCIENELLMYMRSLKKSSKDVSMYDSIGSDREGNEIRLLDIIEYEDEDVTEQMVVKQYLRLLPEYMKEVLTERERRILSLRYGLDGKGSRPQWEVAKQFDISRSYVSRIEKKALRKLRECYE